ncbi:hypothetical protein [Archangium lansingense]|uniref:Lipoprotein MlpA n=1 Tax=Archangium lansingense TaxID=2995310 RepID=A0ABT4A0T1_9BACT|nr:hypothetical protein [Archangium lansinium]MCY1075255.1 hypothetical protein [Archangium lansinium]
MYTLKNADDATKSCGQLKGEALGVWKYVEDPLGTPKNVLVIRPQGTASRFAYTYEYMATDAKGNPVKKLKEITRVDLDALEEEREGQALEVMKAANTGPASLDMEANSEGLCTAKDFSRPATVNAAEARHHETNALLAPAETITYTYSNVQVYSAASAPGTQLTGTFTYSDGPGCTVEYEVNAIWPQVLCNADAEDSAEKCGEGSGINPDFDVRCDESQPDTMRDDDHNGFQDVDDDGNKLVWKGACVPSKKVPSFK